MSDIEDRFIAFLRQRIADMGVEGSGAYSYYERRATTGQAFMDYERVVMRDVLALRPSRVVHAGIGVGQVVAALAQSGLPAIGYEADGARFVAAEALREALGLTYDLRKAYYPDDDLGDGGLLLFTNVGAGWTREQEDAVIDTFGHFDVVILDLRLFGHVRDTDEERDALRARIARLGKVENLPPIHGAAYIRLRPTAEVRKQARERGKMRPRARLAVERSAARELMAELDARLLAFHGKRLQKLGRDESGLFQHYETLLNGGSIFESSDEVRIPFVLERLPAYDRYVVLRGGLGETAFALAEAGRRVTVWEPNAARRKAIDEAFQHLSAGSKAIRNNFTHAKVGFTEIPLKSGETSLGIAFGLIMGGAGDDDEALARAAARTHALLYTPRLFLRTRDPATADAEARALLKAAGYKKFEPVPGTELVLATR